MMKAKKKDIRYKDKGVDKQDNARQQHKATQCQRQWQQT